MQDDAEKLALWERMARAIIRAHAKLPMTKHNEELNKELRDLRERCQEIEPSLKVFYPLD
jgi:hypothetical protein